MKFKNRFDVFVVFGAETTGLSDKIDKNDDTIDRRFRFCIGYKRCGRTSLSSKQSVIPRTQSCSVCNALVVPKDDEIAIELEFRQTFSHITGRLGASETNWLCTQGKICDR